MNKFKFSFEEIVKNRKPNQIWEGQVYQIIVDRVGDIFLKYKDDRELGKYIVLGCTNEQYILKGNGISISEAISKCEKNENKRMKSLVTGREYRINNDDIETLSASGLVWLGTSLCYEEIKGGWVVYEI